MPTAAIMGATALIGSNAARDASRQQMRGFQNAQAAMRPFMLPGQGAVHRLSGLYGIDPTTGQPTGQPFNPAALDDFRNSPDYQFALTEGIRGVENSMAGRGMLRSGNTLRALTEFGQGLATQQFGNYRGALERLAQMGAGAAGNVGQMMIGQGTAQASGTIGAANSWTNALGSLGNYFMLQNLMGGGAYGGGNKGLGPWTTTVNPSGFGNASPPGFGVGQPFSSVPWSGF